VARFPVKFTRIFGGVSQCLFEKNKQKQKVRIEKESSFCEQKEAKKLCQFGLGWIAIDGAHEANRTKVFFFFFQKRRLASSLQPIDFTYLASGRGGQGLAKLSRIS
jgi:hypothetical protein